MDEKIAHLLALADQSVQGILEYLRHPSIIYQLLMLVSFLMIAFVISWWVEPRLKRRAQGLGGTSGFRRVVHAVIERTEWAFFVLLTAGAYTASGIVGWPEKQQLTSNVLLLALAWLAISVLSHTINSRALRNVLAAAGWAFVAVTILGINDDVRELLLAANIGVGQLQISLWSILRGTIVFGLLLWLAYTIGNFLDHRVQRFEELTPSLRVLVGKILRISLVILAGMVAMSALEIDLTVFTVLSGAIGVGIGFGLQKVVSNFISGIIILADRSIKPGDTISLGETFGWIRELRARFVSVVTRDGREYLIPNEDFITREVINWSFSDDLVRLDVPFGVSYDSDPHVVTNLSVDATNTVSRIVQDQKPVCWMTGFGDSSLDFVLRFWIRDPQNGLTNIRGQVLLALWDTFKENSIKIPYPHREVIMKAPLNATTD
ncbi:MAG: mechanosensitive ion channel [Gammaproteobacteria bacterium]|nr:mechanosensitive ion channel [Gammaproteobacteria bacterium]MDH4314698.1 mechanosensitive ion channel [Gammaproteobacteria bacterium]MDH5214980.1 mechanosensitive ion channel [Gammaproteobacteria bacterium]MDH5500743.1 mechanosensitive ion channel [Gammaproteobacteria bacterium]